MIVNSTKPNLKIKGFGLFNAATVSRAIAKAAGPDALLDLKYVYNNNNYIIMETKYMHSIHTHGFGNIFLTM